MPAPATRTGKNERRMVILCRAEEWSNDTRSVVGCRKKTRSSWVVSFSAAGPHTNM
ncbi:hypothetical protein PISMIDRAFT_374810 [Pisolithus microcarpus 441]|uniref:Uncharacterized protein n=1 Tax=Pisolithus microcarpus 441 TaxID=765257 RepID=A0A0C9ZR93_9AGAM|nr:hypothetical protein PISMIDRAFT_374810 [Pisolithus microcarpus 441]